MNEQPWYMSREVGLLIGHITGAAVGGGLIVAFAEWLGMALWVALPVWAVCSVGVVWWDVKHGHR